MSTFPTLCSTNHRTHRNDEDIHQEMTAIGGKGTAGVRQRGKMLMKRRGHAHTHKEAFSQCQGLQMVKLPDHCSGKLSQLLNALALPRDRADTDDLRIDVTDLSSDVSAELEPPFLSNRDHGQPLVTHPGRTDC